jgi:hypothetical protein
MLHKVSYSDEALRKIKDTESAHEICTWNVGIVYSAVH